jgi:hypothetical protein
MPPGVRENRFERDLKAIQATDRPPFILRAIDREQAK